MRLTEIPKYEIVLIDANIILYALLVAVAERLRIQAIASADKVLGAVRGMILYSPDDLEK
jgi:hypothetical protein